MTVKKSTKATSSSQMAKTSGDMQKDNILSRLLEMGFGYEESLEALQATDYDLTNASSMLAQKSVDYGLSTTPTSTSVDFMDTSKNDEPAIKRKDRGWGSLL